MVTRTAAAQTDLRPTVSIAMKASQLRALLSTDLERNGFDVLSVRTGADIEYADVVVTDFDGPRGRRLTVRVGDDIEVYAPDGTWWFPATELGRLAKLLHAELGRAWEPAVALSRPTT